MAWSASATTSRRWRSAGGEAVERLGALDRFRSVVDVFLQLVRAELQLSILTGTLGRVSSLVPLLLAAPSYFSGLVTLGLIVQTRVAYDQVSGALSWFVNAYREIARWRANIERLAAFSDVMDATARDLARAEIQVATRGPEAIRLVDVRLEAPGGRVLIDRASAAAGAGERVAVLGPPGRGKTTLFRSLAGIWPFGAGRIERPPRERMLFVPQRAYLPLGTLRAVVSYPAAEHSFDDAQIREALRSSAWNVSAIGSTKSRPGTSSSRRTSSSCSRSRARCSSSPIGCCSTRRLPDSTSRPSGRSTTRCSRACRARA